MNAFAVFAIVLCLAAAVPAEESTNREERSYGAAPSYSAPAAPSYSAPSYSAPAPAPSYSAPAPAPSYSAPAAPSYSAPAAPAYSAPAAPAYSAPAAPAYSAPAAPAYSAPVSIPAPPCPKNYLFSCQPSLTPAPCAQPAAGGYGSAGAYSQNYPLYAPPQYPYVNAFQSYY